MPLNVGDARFGCYLGCGGARMGGDAARNARRAYLAYPKPSKIRPF